MTGSIEQFVDLAADVLARPAGLGAVRVAAIDGPAGSGKTTFAGRLVHALRANGVEVAQIHTDDLLDGWGDPRSYWSRLREWILRPLSRGELGSYRCYNWQSGYFDEAWQVLPVPDVLVVEGVASIGAVAEVDGFLGIYVIAHRDLRLARGIARDGEALRDQWLRWMAAEDDYFARADVLAQADIVVDGAPTRRQHDPATEFVRLA